MPTVKFSDIFLINETILLGHVVAVGIVVAHDLDLVRGHGVVIGNADARIAAVTVALDLIAKVRGESPILEANLLIERRTVVRNLGKFLIHNHKH